MKAIVTTTAKQKEQAFAIRHEVFVKEQNVPIEIELDDYDEQAIHFLCYNDQNEPVGASRIRFVDSYGKLERICVLKSFRGQSYGKQLVQKMEEEIIKNGFKLARLNAQMDVAEFYENLGYKVISEPFSEANILHITMEKSL
jgi:predicted GNAT family N-acyltransferase